MVEAPAFAPPYLTDAEIDGLCDGLKQNAAKCRYIAQVLKLPVQRKPNGRPLVARADYEHRTAPAQNGRPVVGPKWRRP